ncbi:MAG: ATP-binding protein [Nitrospirota bacterium]|nr:ATP-binding protein [Nitrospirota bacterium]
MRPVRSHPIHSARRWFRDLPIRRKLTATTLLVSTTAMLLTAVPLVVGDLHRAQRDLLQEMRGLAAVVALGSAPAVAFLDPYAATETLHTLSADRRIRGARLLTRDGQVFASYVAPGTGVDPFRGRAGLSGADDCGVPRFSVGRLFLCAGVEVGGQSVGSLELVADLGFLQAHVHRQIGIAVGVFLLALAVAWGLARALGRVIAAPVQELAHTAATVTTTRDYSRRAAGEGVGGMVARDEIGALTTAFNQMLEQVQSRDWQLQQHSERLEAEVEARTAELSASVEQLRMAKSEAETASQAKSQFLSRMSHELRTPMNAILGFSQLLGMAQDEPLSERQKEYMGHVTKAGHHLLELINEVLDLARIESGRMTLSTESLDVGAVVAECLELTRAMAGDRHITLVDATHDLPLTRVRADRVRLRQALLNLLSNAAKYSVAGGTVTVSCDTDDNDDAGDGGKKGADVADDTGLIMLRVTDTGPGIPAPLQEHLFEPFNRLGAEDSGTEGTGIGLVITLKLVEMMRGRMGFSSRVGEGSQFWIGLPRVGPGEAQAADTDTAVGYVPAACKPLMGAYTLLYIEDNPANLHLLQELVRQCATESRMLSASSAELGLLLARSEKPHAILMDINLPGMDGFEALRRLRTDAATRSIPVIAVSADGMADQVQRGMDAGFAAYVTKPFRMVEVLDALRAALKVKVAR